jgi:ATP phosphoribosyltransferase regulatory subunit
MQQSNWFTPEGLEDLLPSQSHKLEFYRRELLDGFHLSGFDLVLPPIAEFTDALLTGTARHMAVDTCRFTDQESGRMMGVRADMTPQVARIVSNRLKPQTYAKLCYAGEVLKTKNNKAKGSRSPMQIGAEIFGHEGIESDIEIIELMLESMARLGLDTKLSLGHVGIVDELVALASFSKDQSKTLIDILERKGIPEFEAFVESELKSHSLAQQFSALISLCGDAADVLEKVDVLKGLSSKLDQQLDHLAEMIAHLNTTHDCEIHLDLADIRGYQYHTGIIFATYVKNGPLYHIAKGGRYDGIGADFGLSLPATGFSLDLRMALDLLDAPQAIEKVVYVLPKSDVMLATKIAELKQQGYQVIKVYSESEIPANAPSLIKQDNQWVLQ